MKDNRSKVLIFWNWAFIGRSRDQRTFAVGEIGGSDIYGRRARIRRAPVRVCASELTLHDEARDPG
jgi:hypothetical protein